MSEPNDPGRAGVKAGRVVGLLTATLAVLTVWQGWSVFSEGVAVGLGLVGLEPSLPAAALFWGNAAVVAVTRYTFCYVVGSLVGILYGWLGRPPRPVLVGVVLVVGVADGVLAGIDTQRVVVGTAYVVAWLWYVPVFVWVFDPDAGDSRSGPRRLGES